MADNMDNLLAILKKKQDFEELCINKGINAGIFTIILSYLAQGCYYDNKTIAQKLGLHKLSVDRYNHVFDNMTYSELSIVFSCYLSMNNDDFVVDISPEETEFLDDLKKLTLGKNKEVDSK